MPARRPALIFDFGNVVAFFDYSRACETFGRPLGLTGDAFLGTLRDRGLNGLVRRYECGAMSSEAFTRAVAALADLDLTHDAFAAAWSDIFRLNRPVAELIVALKRRGYRLVLGSNTNELHARQFRRQFADILGHFDRLVLSYEVGHVKPSAPFYHACAEAAGADRGDCVFIDDLPENVDGARRAGLRGVHFRDVPGLLRDLAALGVEAGAPGANRGPQV
jgi:putative hydrolase of the HAD superfamily